MKKIFLVLIVLMGSIPIFSQGFLKVTAGTTINSNNGAFIVVSNMNLVNDGTLQQGKTDGTIKLVGNGSSNISGTGITSLGRMQLALDPGSIFSLQSNIKVDSEFVFTGGRLNLDNYQLDLGTSGILTSESETNGAYSTGTGYIEAIRNLNNPLQVKPGNLGAAITSTSNLGSTIIRRGHAVQVNINGSQNSIRRYYDIIPANNNSLNATLRINYFNNELNSVGEGTLSQWRSADNITWTSVGFNTRDTIANFVEKTAIANFSRFTLAQAANTVRTISVNNPSINEGDNGTRELKFVVRLNAISASVVTVEYTTEDSTATAGNDYTFNSGTITFNPGQLTDTIRVFINGDAIVEPDEYVLLRLSNAINGSITTARGRGVINNDDSYPMVTISNYSLPEGNVNDSMLMVKVRLSKSYPLAVSLGYNTQDSTAIAGQDYLSSSGTLTFIPGDTLEYFLVTIKSDLINESNEILHVNLNNAVNCIVTANDRGRITINNDDVLPQIVFNNLSVTEGNNDLYNNVNLSVRLNKSYPLPVTVNYQTQDSTAIAGSDYQTVNAMLTFVPGDTLESFSIPVLGDRILEANEIIKLLLSGATNATISNSSSRITLTNDDSYPVININNITITEGDAGTQNVMFTLRINKRYPQNVNVQFATQDVTAIAGNDYSATTGNVTFPADGDTLQTVIIPVAGDLVDEANETFKVQLNNPVNGTLGGGGSATGTITDNDPVPAIRIYDTTATEASGNAVVRIALTAPSGRDVSVSYRTQDGTAQNGSDYSGITLATLTFLPGETVKTINVAIISDGSTEGNETFSVILQSPVNGTLAANQGGDNTAIVTIINSANNLVSNRRVIQKQMDQQMAVQDLRVTTSPNPFRNNALFHVIAPENGTLYILIYDVTGSKIAELKQEVLKNIPTTLQYRNHQMRQGMLFYKAFINQKSVTGKLTQVNY